MFIIINDWARIAIFIIFGGGLVYSYLHVVLGTALHHWLSGDVLLALCSSLVEFGKPY